MYIVYYAMGDYDLEWFIRVQRTGYKVVRLTGCECCWMVPGTVDPTT